MRSLMKGLRHMLVCDVGDSFRFLALQKMHLKRKADTVHKVLDTPSGAGSQNAEPGDKNNGK